VEAVVDDHAQELADPRLARPEVPHRVHEARVDREGIRRREGDRRIGRDNTEAGEEYTKAPRSVECAPAGAYD
jgi:hypothetical protein